MDSIAKFEESTNDDDMAASESILQRIKPVSKQRVLDLVRAAGVDVSDWKNFAGGEHRASVNPKYCYEWAFVQPGQVVVLNLWFASMSLEGGQVSQRVNMQKVGAQPGTVSKQAVWAKRARKMDEAIQTAYREHLPIRVVICDGQMRQSSSPDADPSRVTKRLLDPVAWAVTSYDRQTGECIITRGADPSRFVDQFSIQEEVVAGKTRLRVVSAQVFDRDPAIRRRVLARAGGKCERCGREGFTMSGGQIYLETHHIVPLCEDGADLDCNVVALCPNDHREAHHGENRSAIRSELLRLASEFTRRQH